MNDSPRVIIGLPVYNGQNYLKEAIESVLAQTFTNFLLVISDNASTDATEAAAAWVATIAEDGLLRVWADPSADTLPARVLR